MTMRRSLEDYDRRLVVFDTNVVEARYLEPLLRGQDCRDLARLRDPAAGYSPAIFIKSYYEICQHAKHGTKKLRWCSAEYGYPGGLDVGRRILSKAGLSAENLYWWFSMAEEWRGLDWREHEAELTRLAAPSVRRKVVQECSARREFASWKFSLSAFCERIWAALQSEFTVLTPHDVYGFQGEPLDEVFQLEQDLAERRIVPSEDFEIVTAALAVRASALVTIDKALLTQAGMSIDLNWKTAFVHPDHLMDALDSGFAVRWSAVQASPPAS